MENLTPNCKNGHCPVCNKVHKNYDEAYPCGMKALATMGMFKDHFDEVPEEIYNLGYYQTVDMADYLKHLPGYPGDEAPDKRRAKNL
jgi:hypothetical protein